MASSAASFRQPKQWRKEGSYTVNVVQDREENLEAEVRMKWFETDEQNIGLDCKLDDQKKLIVLFPVPIYTSAESSNMLRNTVIKFLEYIRKSFTYRFSLSVDRMKGTWTTYEFCRAILVGIREYLQMSFSHRHFKEITVTFCAVEGHSFDEAVKACDRQLPLALDLKLTNLAGHSRTTMMYVQFTEQTTAGTKSWDRDTSDMTDYPFQDSLDLCQSDFNIADVEKIIQTVQDVRCELNLKKSNVIFHGNSKDAIKVAKDKIVSLLLPPRVLSPRKAKSTSDDTFTTYENIVVKVYVGNILNLPVDCIVNAANTTLQHHGGIAKSIAKAAGSKFLKESSHYVKHYGNLTVGGVCTTTAGDLNYKFVVHAVGPCWELYKPYKKEDVVRCENDLYRAVLNSLSTADKYYAKTIALPTISSGQFACPKELCAVQYAHAIVDFSRSSRSLKEIHFVDLNSDTISIIKQIFHEMIPNGRKPDFYCRELWEIPANCQTSNSNDQKDRHMSSTAKAKQESSRHGQYPIPSVYPYSRFIGTYQEPSSSKFICCFGKDQTLHIYTDDILALPQIDIIVCGNDKKGTTLGKLAQTLAKKCKDPYMSDVEKAFKVKPKSGDVILINCKGVMNFKWIAHAVSFMKEECKTKESGKVNVTSMYREIFKKLQDTKCSSLALPLIGTGTGGADPALHCECLVDALDDFCRFNKSYRCNIHLVHKETDKTRTAIECVERKIREFPSVVDRRSKKPDFGRSYSEKSYIKPARYTQSLYNTHTQDKLDRNSRSSFSGFPNSSNDVSHTRVSMSSLTENNRQLKEGVNSGVEDYSKQSIKRLTCEKPCEVEIDIDPVREKDLKGDRQNGEMCVICMETIKKAQHLPCGHSFCRSCIEEQFTYKETCPICGQICGIIKGDQPDGTMDVTTNHRAFCTGYENDGRIEITYKFPPGIQRVDHPNPGKPYKGIERTAYLPNNTRGKKICEMLRVAFERKLVFTIGRSRTTGAEGVITWNDIHHKTDPKPNSQFGYPDPTYLDRVTDELKIKGVTVEDISALSHQKRNK